MFVSLNWLRNYVDLGNLTPEELAEKITKSGIEVDGIEYIAEKSNDVVIGYVETCERHPNADKLSLCSVDVGEEKLQIICGAPNIMQGQKVAVAQPGSVLPGNFKIKKTKLRGVESNGMICSMQELGLKEQYLPKDITDGIVVLPDDAIIGESVSPLLNLDDAVLEFDLTPNRADSLSMLGVAYEVAAILDKPILLPDEDVEVSDEDANAYINVEIEDTDLNPYYGAFMIKNLVIKPSPPWIANYLMASGIRPINNVVDITNYVLLEYGQPLHAFDYDRLQSEKILVRTAKQGEKLVTLDEKERILSKDHLVITDGNDPIALAGVMGGASTEVTEETTTVLLEAAYFAPTAVRKTVQDTGLRSESSSRFEKGIDPNRVKAAGLRACQLLQQYAEGEVLGNAVEIDQLNYTEKTVEMNVDEINNRLGTAISTVEIVHILNKLRFNFRQNDKDFIVYAPTRRQDIKIFEDMLEEVARIYGYDNLPFTLPMGASHAGSLTERQQLKRNVKNYLQSVGLMETMTYSLTNKHYISTLISPEIKAKDPKPVELAMPMSEDHKYLRLSILPELLSTLAYNQARNQIDLSYYELGSIFISNEKEVTEQPDEHLRLAGALTGKWLEHQWQQEKKEVDFYVVKGIVEGLFDYLNIPVTFEQAKLPKMHPGRCATVVVHNKTIGFVGQLHPIQAKNRNVKETYVFDVNMEEVFAAYNNEPSYNQIPKYPSVTRDIAFTLDDHVVAGEVKSTIEEIGAPLVKNVQIFDVYQGDNLAEGKKSIAYSLLYQHPDKTLKDHEVEESYQKIIETVNTKFNAHVRS
ncbi:phenylalanyl-tRNA synthetase beta chain [Virgibacillus natechei]|uniref:Phenylalanine--tRNA ligase beta subunit n=1 Tax=Virgibacillus natechei TaxID=1216297 RepID=A0ABS4ID28_9BACI|nr:phenylalanine--tRNA ligase subunit beta [Virgibacillus natechei]MBP1968845.1 phenylalanyl-tRNA synthetase beta chain [Virgibacillus natechei]UZD11643.1 phenylalanine--tRNA ligase subunit beta [Virgibacillus natechei]